MQVSDWFEQVGDVYLNKKDLGSSLAMANALRDEQVHFERQARVCTSISSTLPLFCLLKCLLQRLFKVTQNMAMIS